MKKTMILVLSAVLLLLLASCSSNDERGFSASSNSVPAMVINSLSFNQPKNQTVSNDTSSIGDVIQFGGINWLVLEVQDDRMLIISEDIVEYRVYDSHGTNSCNIWESSDIRAYLNGEFLNQNFTKDENALILETLTINDNNPEYGTSGGNNTYDKLFLLSRDEMDIYFDDDADRIAYDGNGVVNWWWLRSPGAYSFTAACITSAGYIYTGDYVYFDVWETLGIRPALWLSVVYAV